MYARNMVTLTVGFLLALCAASVSPQAGTAPAAGNDPVAVSDLVNRAREFDARAVVVHGEILGDVMRRGEYVWLNLLDDGVAIGVWAKEKDLPAIGYKGSYWAKGDIVSVEGTFHRACPDHGGDLDLHAASIATVQRGIPMVVKAGKGRIAVAMGFCLAGAVLTVRWRRREGEAANS